MPIPVIEISLNKTSATVNVGENTTLTATVSPSDATNKNVKWSLSGTAVKLYSDTNWINEVSTDATDTLTVYAKGESAGSTTVPVTSDMVSTVSKTCSVHVHNFTYSADSAIITATCFVAGCTDPATSATLTINKPTLETYGQTGESISASATLDGLTNFNTTTGLYVSEDNIK
ncbi:MAG: Ig-like domain-containing protein [Clostridia bacterium]|nr:Ig-like domain-containing protein [Clostridia bacterium]